MNMKMNRLLIALLSASVAASASAVADNQKALQDKADSANAKRGVEISGSIRAVAQRSSFSTDNDLTAMNHMPDVERNEFVSADLNFGFRPYETVRANVLMRLGGGMQEYFAAAAKTLEAKWLNVEGNVGKNFYWTVGDFRSAISPLTIYNPGVDILYEPTIFARKRHMAEKEQLLEGNKRNLQGVNLQFRQEIDPMVGELRAEAFFARVNRVSVLDFSGAEGNILPNDTVNGTSLSSATDKWLVGGNIELLPMQKNVYVGVTPMLIFDNENSKSYTYRHPRDGEGNINLQAPYELQEVNPSVTYPQNTFVLSARVGADVAALMQNKNLTLDLVAEYAMSIDKINKPAKVVNGPAAIDPETGVEMTDPETGDIIYTQVTIPGTDEKQNGSAILVNLNAGYKVENSWSAGLALDLIRNDKNWFNNLAQSPKFFAQRIMNSDKDGEVVKYGVNSPLYSTFDALYHYSPKFAPVARSLGTDDDAFLAGQGNSYNIAPYNKNSWGSNVYSKEQLTLINAMSDPAVQLALPNGLATANRMGGRAIVKGDWQEKIEAQALVSVFNQVTSEFEGIVDKVSYLEFGAGLKADVAKLAGFSKSFEASASYKHSESKTNMVSGASGTLKSDFINGGFSLQFLPRLGFTAGVQFINTDYGELSSAVPEIGLDIPLMKNRQLQVMGGFDYSVAQNAWLSLNVGYIAVQNDYNTSSLVDAYDAAYPSELASALATAKKQKSRAGDVELDEGEVATVTNNVKTKLYKEKIKPKYRVANMPDYYTIEDVGAPKTYTHKFSQMILEASINVEF
jgi:hypothetical protein